MTDNDVKVGDVIRLKGNSVEIAEIHSSFYWDRFGWDIEFTDTNGNYRHWKQSQDGGELIMKGVGEWNR